MTYHDIVSQMNSKPENAIGEPISSGHSSSLPQNDTEKAMLMLDIRNDPAFMQLIKTKVEPCIKNVNLDTD